MTPEKSSDYLNRCLETFKADQSLSDETKAIMFNQYAKLVMEETNIAENESLAILLDDVSAEMEYLYGRIGYEGSNILDAVFAKLELYAKYLPPETEELPEQPENTAQPESIPQAETATEPVTEPPVQQDKQPAQPEQKPEMQPKQQPPAIPKHLRCRKSPTGMHSLVRFSNGVFCEFCGNQQQKI